MKLVEEPRDLRALAARSLLVLALVLLIAAIHVLRVGSYLEGGLHVLYSSCFSDLVVPVAACFLLTPSEASFPPLRPWWVKAGLVFAAAVGAPRRRPGPGARLRRAHATVSVSVARDIQA